MQQTSPGYIAPEIQLEEVGAVYRNHSNEVDHYARQGDERMARLAASIRDRIYFKQVLPLIEQFVDQITDDQWNAWISQ
jgi:hypothetical protein